MPLRTQYKSSKTYPNRVLALKSLNLTAGNNMFGVPDRMAPEMRCASSLNRILAAASFRWTGTEKMSTSWAGDLPDDRHAVSSRRSAQES